MASGNGFLAAENHRNGLVLHIIAQHKHGFGFFAFRTYGAFFEINGTAEHFLCLVLQCAVRLNPGPGFFSEMVDNHVDVKQLFILYQIP